MSSPTTLVVSGSPYVSETFIRLHEDRTQEPRIVLRGAYPNYQSDGLSIRQKFGWLTSLEKLLRCIPAILYDRFQLRTDEDEIAREALNRFLQSAGIGCVVAEYGMTGADLVPHLEPLGIPLIVFFHGHDAYHEEYLRLYRDRFAAMFRYASVLFVVSDDMRRQLLALGASPEKVQLNPYGAREHFFECTPDDPSVILGLGRFVETKAPYLTLLAFARVLESCPDAKLVLAGDGPMLPVCKDIAVALKISTNVQFPGQIAPETSFHLFQKARMFVQHSVTTVDGVKEGTPVAVLEASAAGLPVVATRHAGIEQAVLHGASGFLVEERDVESMAQFMVRLWQDKALCNSMGKHARQHVHANYSLDTHLRKLQSAVDTCLDRFSRCRGIEK